MRAIVTGMNGTVAPYLARALEAHGFDVVAWDRASHPPDDPQAGLRFLDAVRPDWLCHIGMGPPEWAGFLAAECAGHGIACLYTSSVSVYADRETGPITPETEPDGTSDYALYKLACEERVRAADPGAVIARIGWQIGTDPGSNNMVDFLHTRAREDGAVHAGTRWYPACSFLEDTAAVLYRLRDEAAPGIYLVDGNRHLSFFEIASALNRIRGRPWQVLPADEPVLDLRMVDRRVERPAIEGRLGLHA